MSSDPLPDNLFYSAIHDAAVSRMTTLLNDKAPDEIKPILDTLLPIISDGLTELIAYIVDAIQYQRVEVTIEDDASNTITITPGAADDPN